MMFHCLLGLCRENTMRNNEGQVAVVAAKAILR